LAHAHCLASQEREGKRRDHEREWEIGAADEHFLDQIAAGGYQHDRGQGEGGSLGLQPENQQHAMAFCRGKA